MPKIVVEGKPQLFFSSNDCNKPWRLIEKIVAIIESSFQETDNIYTYSSIKLPNCAGDLTEVDVAYSFRPNPTEAFRFVQIRDRANTQGRPWVEQVLGQMQSLSIQKATMVSTERFSGEAIRLAKAKNINLRILLPENDQAIKQWYLPDTLGIHRPIYKIIKTVIMVKDGERYLRLDADATKSLENNILTPTFEPNTYRVISSARVFEVDIMKNPNRSEELLGKLPNDSAFHRLVMGIEYANPRLFVRINLPEDSIKKEYPPIFPVTGIVFDAEVSKGVFVYPISYRYKYIDVLNEQMLAQAIISKFVFEETDSYFSLIKHHINPKTFLLNGAFFQ